MTINEELRYIIRIVKVIGKINDNKFEAIVDRFAASLQSTILGSWKILIIGYFWPDIKEKDGNTGGDYFQLKDKMYITLLHLFVESVRDNAVDDDFKADTLRKNLHQLFIGGAKTWYMNQLNAKTRAAMK